MSDTKPAKPDPMTVSQMLECIPRHWRTAPIAVSDNQYEDPRAVQRVALHENADGKRVVVIYTNEMSKPRIRG